VALREAQHHGVFCRRRQIYWNSSFSTIGFRERSEVNRPLSLDSDNASRRWSSSAETGWTADGAVRGLTACRQGKRRLPSDAASFFALSASIGGARSGGVAWTSRVGVCRNGEVLLGRTSFSSNVFRVFSGFGRTAATAENFFREFLASVAEKCFIRDPALQEASGARPKKSRKKVSQTLDMRKRISYICSPFKKWLSQTGQVL
jgi:hypothetical protein